MKTDIENSYYVRNDKWIRPLLITFIFVFSAISNEILGIMNPVASTVSLSLAGIAIIITGVGVMFTDTLSAYIIKLLTIVVLLATLFALVYIETRTISLSMF
ncbi:hypothetical protein DL738_11415 [Escherichia coli]|nr:hypothetical protein [Salmonella enterica]EGE2353454.1 hypothetical protein [Escherichia coli]EFR0233244.1 hypothetical protein [Salmonella enterica]EHE3168807.1 hypothetical protein [Salmonella enterica]EHM5264033.1 hypothetical protein [Salmonella enterica]